MADLTLILGSERLRSARAVALVKVSSLALLR